MSYTLEASYKHGHGDDPVIVTSPDGVDALITALLKEPFEDSTAALYVRERPAEPIHTQLRVAVNAETGVGGLRYSGASGTWYATGRKSDRDEVWYCYMGHDEDWPPDSEIPLDDVRAGVKEFLAGGGERPTCVQWSDWEEGMVGVGDPNASFLVPSTDTEPTDH